MLLAYVLIEQITVEKRGMPIPHGLSPPRRTKQQWPNWRQPTMSGPDGINCLGVCLEQSRKAGHSPIIDTECVQNACRCRPRVGGCGQAAARGRCYPTTRWCRRTTPDNVRRLPSRPGSEPGFAPVSDSRAGRVTRGLDSPDPDRLRPRELAAPALASVAPGMRPSDLSRGSVPGLAQNARLGIG